ncbi:MAG: hypothetical protein ACUVUU_09655 [bacterium]
MAEKRQYSDPLVYQLDEKTRKIIDEEVCRSQPLVGFLTGSGATEDSTSRSDIDIIFITEDRHIVSYRYYMPQLSKATIRTEVGRIPLDYLERVLSKGYDEEISTGLKEQLRKARFLLGDKELGKRIVSSFNSLKPKQVLLGNYMHRARQSSERLKQSLKKKSLVDSMIAIDGFGANCWRILLVAKHHVGVQKAKHEIRAAYSLFDKEKLEAYLSSRGLRDLKKSDAKEALLAAHNLLSKLLAIFQVSDKLVDITEIEDE